MDLRLGEGDTDTFRCGQRRAVVPAGKELQHHHHPQDRYRQVQDEIHEREIGARADHDVGRVADQCRRAADVGRHHHGEQVGRRPDPCEARHLDRHGRDEDDGGDVVREGGDGSRKPRDQGLDEPGPAPRALQETPHGPGKDPRRLEHPDHRHHRREEQEDVQVERLLGTLEGDQLVRRQVGDEPQQGDCAEYHQHPMGLLHGQQDEHPDDDDRDEPLRGGVGGGAEDFAFGEDH